ncbi:MAG: PRC-barrel domain-containing protein [Leptolyngbyaceae cyanobacterium MO_188.B28]|nr:PRC-barrel domain-containing protein [Leptolyngbyaceae cyanobacterium MO_188.B28]
MTFEQTRIRSDIIGTQVITRNTGKRLGVISQLWVDVDRGEVVALGLRENILSGVISGTEQIMLLSSIRQIGDVILVDDETAIEDDISMAPYSTLVRCEVITETGEMLGRVRGFKFDVVSGQVESLIIASFGLPQIPDQVISTYELPIDEIVSSGPDRLIVFEGAEEKLIQLSMGLMERLGISGAPWERDEDENYIMPVSTANQLPSGVQTPTQPIRSRAPVAEERWSEDDWNQPEPIVEREPLRQQRAELDFPQADLEEDNWAEKSAPTDGSTYSADHKEVTEDVWSDDQSPPYDAPPVNIPQKKKVLEYEEEADY